MFEESKTKEPSSEDLKALDACVRRANDGDKDALTRLRNFLEQQPQIWQHVGDLAVVAERAWIALIANGCSLTKESMQRKLAQLKSELQHESDSVVERMLVDTVVATWLELNHLRTVDANGRGRTATQASLMIKRLESAQKRHHNALKQLTHIRKLLRNANKCQDLRVYPYREAQ